jgi:predicted Zn-ribbon and HTH transcriptional regulator
MSDQNVNVGAMQQTSNPLANWYRQPKIYVKLPSGGRFYPQGSLDVSTSGDYPVYAMTAKDELMFKTPDALLSGQSTVEIIKSCVPAILDPWKMPSIDLDFILIAIRIATYGDKMEITTKCPSCESENNYEINLTNWMGVFNQFQYNDTVEVDPLVVHIRPYSYHEMTKSSIKAMEQQRVFNVINDDNLSDEDKVEQFGKSFVKLTELTVDIIAECITSIETPNGTSHDKNQIKEFIDNCSKDVFDHISTHISDIKSQIELKAQHVKCGECDHEFNVPVTMDQSNFFAVKS